MDDAINSIVPAGFCSLPPIPGEMLLRKDLTIFFVTLYQRRKEGSANYTMNCCEQQNALNEKLQWMTQSIPLSPQDSALSRRFPGEMLLRKDLTTFFVTLYQRRKE
ncbi:hypothetical protein CEXT_260331 [Caerostris extrusa]|uniref:Uncharacterized protein n=1 Tax=Caerostris extrusa TaxID=172846 RepID=A0AAV4VMT9_CAEEX|nr:hypothetical protein CEXT_260331 [Caerostris extrusa]